MTNKHHMGSELSNLFDGLSHLDPIPMEDLIAQGAEWKHTHSKNIGILKSVSGITSAISSFILVWMILRSHTGLSKAQHRLLLGLCIYDIVSSLGNSHFNAAVPSEMSYTIWNAKGNQATCNVQGFLTGFGVVGGLFYNAALNLYYLSVVKYEKKEEFIRTKIEPFLHFVPIVGSLIESIYLLIGKHFNDDGFGVCIGAVHYPSHCRGYKVGEIRPDFNIPCGRGLTGASSAYISMIVDKVL